MKKHLARLTLAALVSTTGLFGLGAGTAVASSDSSDDCDPVDNNGDSQCEFLDCVDDSNGNPDCIVIPYCQPGGSTEPVLGRCGSTAKIRESFIVRFAPQAPKALSFGG